MALKEIMREYTDAASQLARDYYHTVRQAWAEYTGQEFPGFNDGSLIDTDRILWQIQHGMANTDYPGLKYRDVKTGSNKAGLTMDDLWPDMTDIDDAQQFIGDMIRTALRSQTQQCVRRDPTQPRWARAARQDMRVLRHARIPRLRLPERRDRRPGRRTLPCGLRLPRHPQLGQTDAQRLRSGRIP